MTDPTLAEVAADVAAALGLKRNPDWDSVKCWFYYTRDGTYEVVTVLDEHGKALILPYLRCACEDWLHTHGYRISIGPDQDQEAYDEMLNGRSELVPGNVHCIPAEAPARLVSAVWRRMQQS